MILNNSEIEEYLISFEKESKAVRAEILKLSWHMRGGLSYDDGMLLSNQERDLIGSMIQDHVDTTNKTGLNYF